MMELALRTTLVFALAFAIAATLRRAAPATRHLLWHITMLIVVAAPLLQPLAPHIAMPAAFEPAMVSLDLGTSKEVPSVPNEVPSGANELPYGDKPTSASLEDSAANAHPVGLSLTMLWAIGSAIVGIWFTIGWLTALWMAGRASRAPGVFEREARAIARELGVTRTPDVRVMSSARGPLTVGLFRPVILLPFLAMEWHTDRRRAVLAHELAHVRRADTRTQALAHIACALYWFNPLAWMAARALRRERERACDDAVVATGIRASSYAQDLLDIARGLGGRVSPSAALAMARRSELEGRLLSLLATNRARRPARATRWVVSTALALVALVVFGAQTSGKAPQSKVVLPGDKSGVAALWYDVRRSQASPERPPTRSAVQALAQSDDEHVRERAAIELAVSDDSSVIDALITALGDASGQVREKAAMGLAVRSSPDVMEPLLRALRDPDAQVREKAAMGLSLRRDPHVVDALLVAATDVDAQVREKVMMALGTSGDPRGIATLRTALQDTDSQVREKAAMGLVLLTSTPMGPVDRAAIESGVSWAVNTILRAIR